MEISTIIGIVVGFGGILTGYLMDHGVLSALWMLSAFITVVGGSFGALFVSYPLSQVLKLPKLFLDLFIVPKSSIGSTIEYLILLATKARQGGLLSLEKEINSTDKVDPFIKRGVLMVVDGTDAHKISEILENDIYIYETSRGASVGMLEALGGFTPAFGMIATIVGLIMCLTAGSESPDEMTRAIGGAFTATFYGVLLANLFFLPAASKLKNRMSMYRMEKEMVIEAVCAIRNGVNPRLLQEQLSSYYMLTDGKQQQASLKSIRGDKAA
jgi:chemotaxis protein MotA